MFTIPLLLQQAVHRYSGNLALLEPTEGGTFSSLSFSALQERIFAFAGALQDMQISQGDRILIWSPSCINWLVAYFGSLLVGAVVVPLDVNSKEDFLSRIAEVTEATLLVTSQKLHKSLQHSPTTFVDIDALPTGTLDNSRLPTIAEHDLAEIVFTSGTTGQPKGVMLSHCNITSNAVASLEVVDIRSTDRALSILPLSHMFELTIELALLCSGASILYARSLSPDTLLKLLSSQGVTCMVLVPQALQLFLNGVEREVRRRKQERLWNTLHAISARLPFALRRHIFRTVHRRFGGSFRFFVSGGAYLPTTLGERWEHMGFRVIQGYGATECSPVISANPFRDHNLRSVGKPLPGVEVRIAEDQEILVRGPNVTQGYWHNPEATAAAFKDDWYCTGDLGYLDTKQDLYLRGRKKNLIVLANGMNVFPEDIENILQQHANVKDAVVLGLPKKDQDVEVHAVLLLDDPAKAKIVVQQVNKQLASHQQIKGFTVWAQEDFPRTHTLKVKRQDVLTTLQKKQEENVKR